MRLNYKTDETCKNTNTKQNYWPLKILIKNME